MARWRASPGEDHRHAQALLPWYVTGQLDAAEALRVKAHLDACVACRAELAAERRLRETMLAAPVEEGDARAPLRRRFSPASAALGAAGAIAASLAVAVVVLSPPRPSPRHAIYRTLGDPSEPSTGQLVVVFDPACAEGQMNSALARAHARIVDGPTATGAYVLRVPHGGRDAALAALRASPGVRLAQSLGGPG